MKQVSKTKLNWIVQVYGQQLIAAAARERGMSAFSNARTLLDEIARADPTNGKYVVFLAHMYAEGKFLVEDVGKLRDTLTLFHRVKHKLPNRDIMSYKTFVSLYDALAPFENVEDEPLTKRQQDKMVKEEGVLVLFEQEGMKIMQLLTMEAAQLYGKGTKWCTAGKEDNMFERYANDGALYVIMCESRKFQLHYESSQFMDEKDSEISKGDIALLSSYPVYKDFLNMLIKKHYSQFL